MKSKGQTLIETALILFILMVILLGITEFSRAWFTKSSLKNAARQGAREAVVSTDLDFTSFSGPFDCAAIYPDCPNPMPANGNDRIKRVACCQPGIKPTVQGEIMFTLSLADENANGTPQRGEEIMLTAAFDNPNFFVVGDGLWPWQKRLNITTSASMRYE
jgi:hypothetical protein